ncbi:MAG: DUF5605 domain-containing protein [Acetatifactor sp.]
MNMQTSVHKWDIFEVSLHGITEGNPFTDYDIRGTFTGEWEQVSVDGFYDGDGIYKVRFMPSFEGEYHYSISGTYSQFPTPVAGTFTVLPAREGNHGPVHVADTFHFRYADGTPYYSIGTTCYVWNHQCNERIRETLESLSQTAFNKIRFCIFPKHYDYNLKEPRSYPYEGTPMDSSVLNEDNFWDYTKNTKERNSWDFTRFNPEHFRHIEWCISELGRLGIQADLILFHPYDRWGFSTMSKEEDDLYVKYVAARFSAFHNVWWALANEYDILDKKEEDWDRFGSILREKDPYNHPRSIHNCIPFYDHTKPWITHCSIQRQDIYKTAEFTNEWRNTYQKPVVIDEMAYEGNIPHFWGNISAEEMTRRFWECAMRGGYPGHGETYESEDKVLWWSHGGSLHGESWKRFRFLYDILCETPGLGLTSDASQDYNGVLAVPQDENERNQKNYMIYYYSFTRPSYKKFCFEERYEAEIIDTWNMTIEKLGIVQGSFRIDLPGRPFMAVRFKKVK